MRDNFIKNCYKKILAADSVYDIAIVSPTQFAPKLSSKKLEDGTMITSELEEMAPFLPKSVMDDIKKEAFNI